MKRIIILCVYFLPILLQAQGKYAGSMKKLIGTSYEAAALDTIATLRDWQFMEGSLVTPPGDPESIVLTVYSKGTTCIVIAGFQEDTATQQYIIADVLEVRYVPKGWQIRTGVCRRNKTENLEVLALVKKSMTQEFLKPASKAWRFNRDKQRFEIIPVTAVDCFNEAMD